MIWNTSQDTIFDLEKRLTSKRDLRETRLIGDRRLKGSVAINYFLFPRGVSYFEKLVVPFTTLDKTGEILLGSNAIYGVTRQPDSGVFSESNIVRTRLQETHVLAEDTALRFGGLLNPKTRSYAETTAKSLVRDAYLGGYLSDRLAHLAAVSTELQDTKELKPDQIKVALEGINSATQLLREQNQ